jgi:hypothetical protein
VTIRQRTRNPRGWTTTLAAVVALALLGAACGDDDDDAEADSAAVDTEQSSDTAEAGGSAGDTGSQGDGDTAAFCDARAQLEEEFNQQPPDPAAVTAAIDDLEAAAPTDLAEAAGGLGEILAASAESGQDPVEDPAFAGHLAPIDEFVLAECGFETVEVSGVDYAFEGVPESVPAGQTAFSFTNDGAEPHEMVIFRRAEGETRAPEELFALPEEEIFTALTFAGAAQAEPGQTSLTITDLEPGAYVATCFVPTGGAEDGPPHFMQGMTAEFEVA